MDCPRWGPSCWTTIYWRTLNTISSVRCCICRNCELITRRLHCTQQQKQNLFQFPSHRRLDSNKLKFLPHGCLDESTSLVSIKLDKNPWHCDCRALYLARWLRAKGSLQLSDGTTPTCRGPGSFGGYPVGLLRYDHLCDGEFLAMVKLSPRIPLRDQLMLKGVHNGSVSTTITSAERTPSDRVMSLQ